MKKILVTNDDGIDAPGILRLVETLAPLAEVYVAAPMTQQSGKSQGITFRTDVDIEEREVPGAKTAWAVGGTPTDCVKIGICKMKEEGIEPDCIFSGINMGYNTGLAVYYSGTVAAAREGALNGIPSAALSVGSHEASRFDYMLGRLPDILDLTEKTPEGFFINVNAPNIPGDEIKGMKIVPAAPFGYGLLFSFVRSDNGKYEMDGELTYTGDSPVYDMDWNREGYMTVTPVPTSINDDEALKALKEAAGGSAE